jgi:HK97 family phage major capsid protein
VPSVFAEELADSEQLADEINLIASVVETASGGDFNYPITDSASASANEVAENAQTSTSAPLVFDNVAFGRCKTVRADDIIAPMELAADSRFPLTSVVAREGGQRIGMYGGAAGVAAIIAACSVGVTTAATNAITGDEILDLCASVDEKYAQGGAFLMSTGTMIALRKLKASTGGSFLLPFGRDTSGRKTLFDFPIYISPNMQSSTVAGHKPIAFGRLDRVLKRIVRNSLTVQTLIERYAPLGQIGWCTRVRMDFKVAVSANGPMPIKLLQMHA